MPESVTDRPTDAYEHILMLTKSERYFWDADAVREPAVTSDLRRPYGSEGMWQMDGRAEEPRRAEFWHALSQGIKGVVLWWIQYRLLRQSRTRPPAALVAKRKN